MPICAKTKLIDGSLLLELDPSVTNFSTCPYVVETGTDSLIAQLSELTPENAVAIASAIALVWSVAWGFRTLAQFLQSFGGNTNEEN